MATTSKGFRYPTSSDTPDVPRDLGYLASDVDSYFNNKQDKITGVSDTEIGYLDGVTSSIQTQLNAKSPLSSPTFTGTPAAPTADAGTNTTQIATTAFVTTAVSNIIDSAPGALNTLNELAAAINDDASYASTITTALGTKAPLQSPTFTGTVDFSGATVNGIPAPSNATPTTTGTVYGSIGSNFNDKVAIGYESQNSLTTGYRNTSFGYRSLYNGTDNTENLAIGYESLFTNTSGQSNTAIGYQALYSNTGTASTALGYKSLYSNTTGQNVAIGQNAMFSNTTGSGNTAIGTSALYNGINSGSNVAIGNSSLNALTGGGSNTAIGSNVGGALTTGEYNTFIGREAGRNITTGSRNIVIGYYATASSATVSNEITLGDTNVNKLRIPGLSVDWSTSAYGRATYSSTSSPSGGNDGDVWLVYTA